MPISFLDAVSAKFFRATRGAGTQTDPFVPEFIDPLTEQRLISILELLGNQELNPAQFTVQARLKSLQSDVDVLKTLLENLDNKSPTLVQGKIPVDSSFSVSLPPGGATDAKLEELLVEIKKLAELSETQPISATALPLPTGASTNAKLDELLVEIKKLAELSETQPVSATSLPLPSGASTDSKLDELLTQVKKQAELTQTQPVSVKSITLPSDASTETTLLKLPQAGTPITGQSVESGGDGLFGWISSLKKLLAEALPQSKSTSGRFIVDADLSTYQGADLSITNPLPITPGTSSKFTLHTRHEDKVTPLSIRFSDGTNFIDPSTKTDIEAVRDRLPNAFGSQLASKSLSIVGASDWNPTLHSRHEDKVTPLAFRASDGNAFIKVSSQQDIQDVRDRLPIDLGSKISTESLSIVGASDWKPILNSRHEAKATPLAFRASDGTDFITLSTKTDIEAVRDRLPDSFGAQLANKSLSIVGASNWTPILNVRHEAKATPLATRLSDGTNFITVSSQADIHELRDRLPDAFGSQTAAKSLSIVGASDWTLSLDPKYQAKATPLAARLSDGTNFINVSSQTDIEAVRDRLPDAFGSQTSAKSFSVVGASDWTPTLSSRHEAKATPLATRVSDGTEFIIPSTKADIEAVRDRLPATLAQKVKDESLSIVGASDWIQPVALSKPDPIIKSDTKTNADATITFTGQSSKRIFIESLEFGYNAFPTAGLITISSGANTKTLPVTNSGPGSLLNVFEGDLSGNVTITLGAGGTSVVGYINATGRAYD